MSIQDGKISIGEIAFDLYDEEQPKPWDFVLEWDRDQMWYDRFRVFLETGRKRSMKAAYKVYKEQLATLTGRELTTELPSKVWYEQAKTAFWIQRAQTWDNFLTQEADRDLADQMIERRKQIIQRDWEVGDELGRRALQYLEQFKIFDHAGQREIKDPTTGEKRIIEVIKSTITISTITGALTAASQLMRRSVGIRDDGVLILSPEQRNLLTGVSADQNAAQSWESAVENLEAYRLSQGLKEANARIVFLEHLLHQHGIEIPAEEKPELALPTFIDGTALVENDG